MVYGYGLYIPNCPECGSNDIDIIDEEPLNINDYKNHDKTIFTCTCNNYNCRNEFRYLVDISGKYI